MAIFNSFLYVYQRVTRNVAPFKVHVSDPFFAQFLCGGLNLFTVNEMRLGRAERCRSWFTTGLYKWDLIAFDSNY